MKRENKSQAKAQECSYQGPAPNHPRDAVRVLTKHRTLLITCHATWQRVSPSPPVPAQMHDCPSQEEGGSEANVIASEKQHAGIFSKSLAAAPIESHRNLLWNLRAGDVKGYDSFHVSTTRTVVRGEGRAPGTPVTKSVRVNWRTPKHIFCWLCSTTHWPT